MAQPSMIASNAWRKLRLYLLASLVYVGIASLVIVPALQRYSTSQRVKAQLTHYIHQAALHKPAAASSPSPISDIPVTITISRLGINLPVAPGYYNQFSRKWTLDSIHVFTDSSTTPHPLVSTKQFRVTVFYGHDIPGILISTSQLTYGDIMTITTQNGYVFQYYYDTAKVVAPTDTTILDEPNRGDPVSLVTCTGLWYQFRHVMYFHLLSVQSAAALAQKTKPVAL